MPSPRKGGTVPIRRGRKAKARAEAPWGLGLGSPTLSRPSTASGSTPSGDAGGSGSPPQQQRPRGGTFVVSESVNAGGFRPRGATFVVSRSAEDCSSSSSWTDATDSDGGGSTRHSLSSSESSSGGSAKSEDGSSGDDENDEEDGGKPRRKRRWRRKRLDGGGAAGSPGSPRGRSWSRRGARKRGGSVLCRFCGRRGFGVMKMVFSCCSRQVRQDGGGFAGLPLSSRPRVSSLSLPGPGRVGDELAWASPKPSPGPPPPSPCLTSPRYNWSPTSSSSSSSTLSDSTVNGHSSGEEADVECKDPTPPHQLRVPQPVQLLHCGGHVTITRNVTVS